MIQRWLGVTPDVPIFVWAIVLSVIIGTAMTNFLTRAFIDPIMKLREEMLEVAGGNFHVTAVCTSRLREVREIYDSFNRMVRELGTTETLQTDFISSVSHEFKTPINAIEGYAALLQDHQQSQAEQEVYIEKILFNTRRLSTLTGNILLLSKLNNQSIRPQKTRFRLDEQVRQAILALEQKWTEKELEFDVELDKTEYSGYENLLLHVWTNLIDNAVKFTPAGSMIRMRLQRENDELLFTIEDSGPGIPEGEFSQNSIRARPHARWRGTASALRWCARSWRSAAEASRWKTCRRRAAVLPFVCRRREQGKRCSANKNRGRLYSESAACLSAVQFLMLQRTMHS